MSRCCFAGCDRIIAVSKVLKQILVEEWRCDPGRIYVLPNAADVDAFDKPFDSLKAKRKLGLADSLTVGFVGTLQEWYGIEYLIDAFPTVLRQIPSAKLLIVGDGQARQRLEAQTRRLDLVGNLMFMGNVAYERIPEILSAVDIPVAPFRSLSTGFYGSAFKVFEYMAAGKGIVPLTSGRSERFWNMKGRAFSWSQPMPGSWQTLSFGWPRTKVCGPAWV